MLFASRQMKRYYAAIGCRILIIQFEGYSGVNHKKLVRFTYRFTAWNINVGKLIYNTFIHVMI